MTTLTLDQKAARALDRPDTMTLTEVKEHEDSFTLLADHSGFGLDKSYGAAPEVGDRVTLYTHRGSMIRGMDLNGAPIFYKTDSELAEEHERYVAKLQQDRDDEFEAEREERDAAFASLPRVFQQRIEWFRAHAPRFRQDYEPYEMSACLDAVRIAEWAREQDGDAGDAIEAFRADSYESQQETIPNLDWDRHSGNSFGFAVRLAHHYVTDESLVFLEHGAMTPLVGCEEYGCAHPRELPLRN